MPEQIRLEVGVLVVVAAGDVDARGWGISADLL